MPPHPPWRPGNQAIRGRSRRARRPIRPAASDGKDCGSLSAICRRSRRTGRPRHARPRAGRTAHHSSVLKPLEAAPRRSTTYGAVIAGKAERIAKPACSSGARVESGGNAGGSSRGRQSGGRANGWSGDIRLHHRAGARTRVAIWAGGVRPGHPHARGRPRHRSRARPPVVLPLDAAGYPLRFSIPLPH